MYSHFAYLTSAETKGIVAPVVALPAEAPEGFYKVKLWFGPETSSSAGSQPCDIWITTTSGVVSLPNISSNTSNLSVSLNRASRLLVKGLDNNIYTCDFSSMGKRFTYPADSTLIGGELYVYHTASTAGSVKLSFKASSDEEKHDVVRVSFFQISGSVNDSEISGSKQLSMYINTIPLVAESNYATNDAVLPAEAPSGVYEVLIPNFGVQSTYTIVAYNQGSGNNRPDIIKTLEDCNQPLIYNGDYSDFSGWSYENETGGSTIAIPVGANVVRLSCYFQHVIGEATSLIKVSCNNGFTQGNTIGSIVVRQLA
jgi:hypothetical protein